MIPLRRLLLPVAAATCLLWAPAAFAIDENGNGLSDIWELIYGPGLNPNADDDGDGFTNYQEALTGTNPRDPNSRPPSPAVSFANASVVLNWSTVPGKAYRVQTTDSLAAGAVWTNLGGLMLADGTTLTATFGTGSGAKKYFRVAVADFDSDGDGVSDWEERALGFDPQRPDSFNSGLGDKQSILNALASENAISVAVVDGVATAAFGDTATIRFTRAGNLNPLTVNYTVSGTGVAGTDYLALSGTVTFPLAVNAMDVPVSLAAGANITTTKTVILTLAAGTGYTLSAPLAATVNLSPRPTASGQVVQEFWFGLSGYQLSDIPLASPPNSSRILSLLDTGTNYADDYGSRIRGYLTAPATGSYTFWVAGDDISEFWLSTNDQVANLVRRSYSDGYTNYKEWNKYPTQRSAQIALTAGQRYYFEAIVREFGGGDHLTVGWLKPGQTGTVPSEVVPGSVLSPYVAPYQPPGFTTLYFAPLAREAGVTGSANGFASLRLSGDGSVAIANVTTSGLSGAPTALNLRGPADPGSTGPVLVNLLAGTPQSDGSYVWVISAPATVAALQSGRVYLSVTTAANTGGELRGQFGRTAGYTGPFTPPADPPALPTALPTADEAARFLIQATYGPTNADIALVQRDGYSAWIDAQFALPATSHVAIVDAVASSGQALRTDTTQEAWWKAAVTAPDQLRQRVAFALSQIMVISDHDGGIANAYALSGYYDTLGRNAFANFRQLLEAVTLAPGMGVYLDMLANDKPNPALGTVPNENYGREILQLFSLGLVRLYPDGSTVLDGTGSPVPTYGQTEVIGFSHVFTGWNFAQPGFDWDYLAENWRQPMKLVPSHHDTGAKQLLDNIMLPANQTGEQDLKDALDVIFNHANCGPFVARSLIQRLVTSNPSRGYIYRVAKKFADNGSGVRGDMKAVIKAILTDYEARSSTFLTNANYGKQREPLIRLATIYRAFNGRAQNNRFQIPSYEIADDLGQTALEAPSVFNFYSPFYSLPGEIATAGLTSPEFQISTETTVVTSSNNLRSRVADVRSAVSPTTIGLDLSAQAALAANPATLVDSLNTLLLAGRMSSGLRTQVINAVTSVAATNTLGRAQTAVQMIITSPEFCVQK